MRPLIGVIPLYDDERDSIWMVPGYLEGLREAGAIPLILPLNLDKEEFNDIKEKFSGFLLTGGHDVSPELYGEQKEDVCGRCSPERDRLESMVFLYALHKDIPVLGICRGIQLINALMGGTLYQDLPSRFQGKVNIEHHMAAPYNRHVHHLDILRNTPLYGVLKKEDIGVNSYHHQGIRDVGQGLEVMAYSEDGLAEAVYVPNRRFIWGIQWHPEFMYQTDHNQQQIFRAFVDSCADRRA